MLAWYFSDESRQLRYGDVRIIEVGKTHTVKGTPILCQHGLHASERILDALHYAPGTVVYRVQLSRKIVVGADKACAQRRKYLAGGINIEAVLRTFARRVALDVAHLWDMPQIVREYLETGDESIRREAKVAAATKAAATKAAWAAEAKAEAWAAAYQKYNQWLEEMVLTYLEEQGGTK